MVMEMMEMDDEDEGDGVARAGFQGGPSGVISKSIFIRQDNVHFELCQCLSPIV